jgi:hypothetical protein
MEWAGVNYQMLNVPGLHLARACWQRRGRWRADALGVTCFRPFVELVSTDCQPLYPVQLLARAGVHANTKRVTWL